MKVYIDFTLLPAETSKKTRVWYVLTKTAGPICLGIIKWYGPWRCYAFHPHPGTVFEKECLAHIGTFCDEETTKHRASNLQLKRLRTSGLRQKTRPPKKMTVEEFAKRSQKDSEVVRGELRPLAAHSSNRRAKKQGGSEGKKLVDDWTQEAEGTWCGIPK